MTLKLPSNFDFNIDFGLDVSGIPTDYTVNANIAPLDLNLGLIQIAPLEFKPLELTLRLAEIPAIRAHLPLDYRVGLSVLGAELLCIRLCGQGQLVTEPYVPNPCETRTEIRPRPDLATLDRLVSEGAKGG